jgi:serine phosphatase RsbU (regulator of sigma subunit)
MKREEIKIKYYGISISKKQFFIVFASYTFVLLIGLVYFTIYPVKQDQIHFLKGSIANLILTNVNLYFLVFLVYTIVEGQFFWNRFTKKQLILIESLKSEIEGKNKNITDSIKYAKHIQNAILPSKKLVNKYFQNSFVLYKPKDIVAGDFYWLELRGDVIYLAAADCTGHGVPGAILSVLCNNVLNLTLREHVLTEPAKILDKTRELVQMEFEKSEDTIRDGMDISLCAINLKNSTIEWAGANNPLWIIRDGSNEIEEIKPDKQPIGKLDNAKPFTNHLLTLHRNDTIYIFSDGYQDQFGGEKGKKLMTKGFKELLLNTHDEMMDHQGKLIDEAFINWKGNNEQNDDVCVIGVCI